MKRYLDLEILKETKLPDGIGIIEEGRDRANSVRLGKTAFMKKYDVSSEAEYKSRMVRENRIMFHAHIGLNSWQATKDALRFLYNEMEKRGLRIDRFGLCLDRAMGLPPSLRDRIPRETGPRLENPREWEEVGQVVPIQPHAGDFMIGFPNSVENTECALQAGITTIGNLSQYFAHQVPGWTDDVYTTVETVKALSILAAFRNEGALVHSYLDDGYGALFTDYVTIVGWAMMEKYVVEDLIGAKLAPSFGGMTADPRKRFSWIPVLKGIFGDSLLGSMFYGDTISYTQDFDMNLGVAANHLLWDILAQLCCPTGHAITPIPITEAIRIPTQEEILQIQILGRKMEQTARGIFPHFQFEQFIASGEELIAQGKKVFSKALERLDFVGIDIRDPVRLLYVLKKLGPAQFENFFGLGEIDQIYLHQRKPLMGVDYYRNISDKILDLQKAVEDQREGLTSLKGHSIVITSTDVHEHALLVLEKALNLVEMTVFNIGAEKNPDQIVDALIECGAEILAISTHNGMACDFAKLLRQELDERFVDIPVFMGGRLNQNVEGNPLPVDVTDQLKGYRVYPCHSVESLLIELTGLFVGDPKLTGSQDEHGQS